MTNLSETIADGDRLMGEENKKEEKGTTKKHADGKKRKVSNKEKNLQIVQLWVTENRDLAKRDLSWGWASLGQEISRGRARPLLRVKKDQKRKK